MPDPVMADTRIRRARILRQGLGCASLAIGACLPMALHAQSANLSGTVALSSQLVDRGLPVTSETPIVQGAVSWASPQGWSLRVSASAEARKLDRLTETFAQAARYWTLAPDWQMGASLSYYDYPGPKEARVYDRVESGLSWVYRDVLTFGLSAIYGVGSGDHRLRGAADVGFHWPLPGHFGVSAGAGIAQSQVTYHSRYEHDHASSYEYDGVTYYSYTRWNSYGYGHVGLMWTYESWHLELDRILTSGLKRPRNSLETAPWVATVSFSF
ncbi:conserved hypothetical protein [Dyella sp. OK004]|uniref:hypothetical protein n=1 Tax=Dyella sp. OK004 TaxID=1855292 RepID=UPI0008E2DAE5|nr:hypothetical protein [Dyella sp. OK004]SFS19969.1 conserved hypothetical protein [Dyella sp. OK004]